MTSLEFLEAEPADHEQMFCGIGFLQDKNMIFDFCESDEPYATGCPAETANDSALP